MVDCRLGSMGRDVKGAEPVVGGMGRDVQGCLPTDRWYGLECEGWCTAGVLCVGWDVNGDLLHGR